MVQPAPQPSVPSGLPTGDIPWGARLCHFYRTTDDLVELLARFVAAGVEHDDRCVWIVDAPITSERAYATLALAVRDIDSRLTRRQVELVDAPTIDASPERWAELARVAAADGYAGLRVCGTAPWLRTLETTGVPLVALCGLDIERCGAHEIATVLQADRSVVIRGHGQWHHIRSATAALALATELEQAPSKLHSVEFFDRSSYPAIEIARRLQDALQRGWGAVALAPTAHLAKIQTAMGDVASYQAAGQLLFVDADAVYRRIAAEPARRDDILVYQLAGPIRALVEQFGFVRAHGELVDVYCRAGDREGAVSLETWWNRQLDALPIELHCGYSIDSFSDAASLEAFTNVCDQHGHVVTSEVVDASRAAAHARQLATIVEVEAARRVAFETSLASSRASEHQLREHLVLLQRVTSAFSEAATYEDIGRVVCNDLALAVGATRCVLAIEGELISVRGVTTPDEPRSLAAVLDRLAPQWSTRPPAELTWLGGALLGVIPLDVGGERRGTLVLGFRASALTSTEKMLVDDLARQLCIAIDRAFTLELARRERHRAETANAAKDHFLAMLGHELRNPLSPILTATQLMRLRAPDVAVRERTTIERSVTHMMKLVDDLLDMAKLTHGKVQLVRTPSELCEVVSHALELSSSAIEERAHRVHVAVAPGILVDVDRGRMAQVISKLIVNSAKYTRSGGQIDIAAAEVGDGVELAVTDNGAGIPSNLLPHIFDLFVQAPQGADRAKGGLGIGLALARSIVELHGGKIAAHSAGPGMGSRFTVTLARWQPHPARDKDSRMQAVGDGRRVLVVDDNEDAAWLLAEALRLAGHEVAVCHDGIEALELARRHQPEIAFLDIGLPGVDGYTLCSQLRELPAKPKIVAVTGYGQAADRDRARAAGFDMHFVKPVSLREVHQAIASFSRA